MKMVLDVDKSWIILLFVYFIICYHWNL